jgi:hypothetical protein
MAIIPGQSLTAEPKNAPYENAPTITKPEEAIIWHLDRLMEPDRAESMLDALELGLDVVTLTEGILRGAVLDGRHSIDVSLIIGPVVHEFIKTSAERVGIDFEEGLPDNSKEKAKVKYSINSKKAADMIDKLEKSGKLEKPMLEPMDDMEQAELPMDMPEEMEAPMEAPMAPQGLMARPTKGGTI